MKPVVWKSEQVTHNPVWPFSFGHIWHPEFNQFLGSQSRKAIREVQQVKVKGEIGLFSKMGSIVHHGFFNFFIVIGLCHHKTVWVKDKIIIYLEETKQIKGSFFRFTQESVHEKARSTGSVLVLCCIYPELLSSFGGCHAGLPACMYSHDTAQILYPQSPVMWNMKKITSIVEWRAEHLKMMTTAYPYIHPHVRVCILKTIILYWQKDRGMNALKTNLLNT